MPVEAIAGPAEWENYHKTGRSDLRSRYALRSAELESGRKDVAEGAAAVQEWLLKAQGLNLPIRPVGGAWSPSNIQLVQQGWMLNTRRFNRIFRIRPEDLESPGAARAEALMLIEGGTQIDEDQRQARSDGPEPPKHRREQWPDARGRLRHRHPRLRHRCRRHPGPCPRHPDRHSRGNLLDRARAGLMSDAFIAATGSNPIRDDETFDAALVAVGSLGIVTALVIETAPLYLVRPVLKLIEFTPADLGDLASGNFRRFSDKHGLGGDPYFVMLILNPHAPFKRKAVVRFLYKEPADSTAPRAQSSEELGAGYDALSLVGWVIRNFPWARGRVIELLMKASVKKITGDVVGTWGETTETHKPLASIFTGALFCERSDLPRAVRVACKAFTKAGGSTAMTLRFMRGGPGLLSPARWQHTAGLDCDGPDDPKTRRAFIRMMAALDGASIHFTRHWGKFNNLDAARVQQDYGSDLETWKRVRNQLLPNPADRELFRSAELDALGLTT